VTGIPYSVSQIEPAEWRRLCQESLPAEAADYKRVSVSTIARLRK
jgi:hypothetical protein